MQPIQASQTATCATFAFVALDGEGRRPIPA